MPSHNGFANRGSLQCVISGDYLYQDVFFIKTPCHNPYIVMASPQG